MITVRIITAVCYLLFSCGIMLAAGITPSAIEKDIERITAGDSSLAGRVRAAKGKSRAFPAELKTAVDAYDGERSEGAFARLCFASLAAAWACPAFLYAAGILFLYPVFLLACCVFPVFAAQISKTAFDKKLSEELETALSVISSSYMRTGSLTEAVRVNLPGLRRPVYEIFSRFLVSATMLSADTVLCIRELQRSCGNPLFKEWCEMLIACCDDFECSASLLPIVERMTEERLVNSELETMISGCRREYYGMVVIMLLNIPLLYIINRDWFRALVGTAAGQTVLVISGCAVLITAAVMMRLTRPVDVTRLRGKNAK